MKTPLIIFSSALIVAGCSKSDTDYSTSSAGTPTVSRPAGSSETNVDRTSPTAVGGSSKTASGSSSDTATSPGNTAGTRVTTPAPPTTTGDALGTTGDAMAEQVRKAISSDQTLSTGANDLQVTMANGKVTLRGTVNSEEAKKNIETKAKQVAGATPIDNQLTVKTQ